MTTKICIKCKKEKPLTEFYQRTDYRKSGQVTSYRNQCRECIIVRMKITSKAWSQKPENRLKRRMWRKKWLKTPRGRTLRLKARARYLHSPKGKLYVQRCNKLFRSRHIEECKERDKLHWKRYYPAHKEAILRRGKIYQKTYYPKYYNLNREKIIKRKLEYYRTHEYARLKNRLRLQLLDALKRYTKTGKIISARKYGIDYDAIIKKLGRRPEFGHGIRWHIDHIRPLASFDLNDPKQVKQAFSPRNLQWLPAEINLLKSAKWHGKHFHKKRKMP